MKKVILGAVVLCSLAATAQSRKSDPVSISIINSGNYQARMPAYSISDPVTHALINSTNGADIKKNSEIIGVSRRAYGFAHGHISLRSSGAASFGTLNGTGSVGTGSTPGSVGTHGAGIGVNGKAPYAGAGIWGTAVTGKGISINDEPVRVKE